jgi:alpha-tubulin suppressor-like RCC1 family protein
VGRNSSGQCNVESWTDIVQVAAGGSSILFGLIKSAHTVGLRNDDTVVAVGENFIGQWNVGNWTDTVQVAAGEGHTVGLKSDGTVVAAGWNQYEQCNVGDWDLS